MTLPGFEAHEERNPASYVVETVRNAKRRRPELADIPDDVRALTDEHWRRLLAAPERVRS